MRKHAIIIGAGPAGLTAAYELLLRTDIIPIILEKSGDLGGICKTVNYKGNRIDIGGHRFFSKSERIMQWWLQILPLEKQGEEVITLNYQNKSRVFDQAAYPRHDEADGDKVMLVRNRLSRIFYEDTFFDYPLTLSLDTAGKLGVGKLCRILFSYLWSKVFPPRQVVTLEDFFIKSFGRELYHTFFKDYTEKVWGIACSSIDAEWGRQRVKGLSISQVLKHATRNMISKDGSLSQKATQTSLIERFLYPKYGPGQLWEEVAAQVQEWGGEVRLHQDVVRICHADGKVTGVVARDRQTGQETLLDGEYFFSSMPVSELITGFEPAAPIKVKQVAEGLVYRDFITVGVLLKKLAIPDRLSKENKLRDNWIYIQDKSVRMGRLQVFNNWSPFMVKERDTVWLGLEYFCQVGDALWNKNDEQFSRFAIKELQQLGFIDEQDVLDSTVVRMEKAYPAYFGSYGEFNVIREYTDTISNLFLVGRNGMHKYNNSDHSMLTAIAAVDNIVNGITAKDNIWQVNTEQDYHETA